MGQNGTGIAIFRQIGETPDRAECEFGTKRDKMGRQWEIPVPRGRRIPSADPPLSESSDYSKAIRDFMTVAARPAW